MLQLGNCYWFCRGCGVRLGYQPFHGHEVQPPRWHKRFEDDFRRPYCQNCFKGFQIRHVGQGVFVRPKEEGDKQPAPAGPKLEELYS